jgi:hypothetical protein
VNTSDRQRFDEIRHRLERTPPDPWVADGALIVARPGTPEEVVIAETNVCIDQAGALAAFFAHSHEDVTWLTERVRDLERATKGRGQLAE